MNYLIDSDILIYCSRRATRNDFLSFLEGLMKEGSQLSISTMNRFEVLSGCRTKLERERNQAFLDCFELCEFGKELWDKAAFWRRDLSKMGKETGLIDVLIETLVKEKKLVLITMNEKHFTGLKPLLRANVPVGKGRRRVVFMGG